MCSASENKNNGTEESETSDDEHVWILESARL